MLNSTSHRRIPKDVGFTRSASYNVADVQIIKEQPGNVLLIMPGIANLR